LLTNYENKHSCVSSTGICCSYTNQVADCNRNTAADDKYASSFELIREVDLDDKRDGTKDIDRDGEVVSLKGGISIQ
jgi:hypothetical protein